MGPNGSREISLKRKAVNMIGNNRQVILASRPEGIPQAQHFVLSETKIPDLRDGQFLVRNHYLSVEPAMRGWVNAAANYSQPVAIGAVMRAMAAGEIVSSKNPDYTVGDRVIGWFGWQEYAVSDGSSIVRKIAEVDLPISLSLGILGINGVTAYLALMDIGQPRPGDTVVVSTAAGSVGSAVGQLAKLAGARTVGITGGPAKVSLCQEAFGYDVALDYKSGAPLLPALQSACPGGANVYFDNTAGGQLPCRQCPRRDLRHGIGPGLGAAAAGPAAGARDLNQTPHRSGLCPVRSHAPLCRCGSKACGSGS